MEFWEVIPFFAQEKGLCEVYKKQVFIYFLVIWKGRLLHLRSSSFCKGYKSQQVAGRLLEDSEKKNERKKEMCRGGNWDGLLPIFQSWS